MNFGGFEMYAGFSKQIMFIIEGKIPFTDQCIGATGTCTPVSRSHDATPGPPDVWLPPPRWVTA